VPSNKRERQRAAREARREAEAAAFRRAKARKRIFRLAILAVLGLVAAYAVYNTTKPEATDVATGTSTTTDAGSEPEYGSGECPPVEGAAERTGTFPDRPPKCIEEGKKYTATFTTDAGEFTAELAADKAPLTVNNFVFLARHKFYDGVPFHRVIPGFVVQGGGGEKGDPAGDPGYKIRDELPGAGEYEIGSLAMANSSRPHTGGSQFFVVTGEQGVQLPPSYSLFGKVIEGMDVVKKIEADGTPGGKPATVHKTIKVTITES